MILKTIIAGLLRQQILYTNIRITDFDTLEARREKKDIRRQSDYWQRSKKDALGALIAANFTDDTAYWCTFDFRDADLPASRDKVSNRFGYMIRKIKQDRPGAVVRYIKSMEHRHGAGRWHVHAVISGASPDELKRAWIYGRVKIDPLDIYRVFPHRRPDGSIAEGLAAYLVKELPEKIGQRLYQTSTRDARLKRPDVIRQHVPDDYIIVPPDGCKVLEGRTLAVNPCGSSYAIAWLLPPPDKGGYRGF